MIRSRLIVVMSILQHTAHSFTCGDVIPATTTAADAHSNSFTVELTNSAMQTRIDLVAGFQYQVVIKSDIHTTLLGLDFSSQFSENSSASDVTSNSQSEREACPLSSDVYELPLTFTWTSPDTKSKCITLMTKLVVNTTYWILKQTAICKPQGCLKYFTTESDTVTSENFPLSYPDSVNCTYIIYLSDNRSIDLQFQEFDVEDPYQNKCLDYVSISYDNVTTGPICGRVAGEDLRSMHFVSKGNLMTINFVSDNKISHGGFLAVYQSSHLRDCNSTWTSMAGEITSPAYPSKYYPNLFCVVTIVLPADYRIILTPVDLDFPGRESQSCDDDEDFITIEDANVNRSVVKWCRREQRSAKFESSRSSIVITFASDHVHEGRGFRLRYRGIVSCKNQTYNATRGVVDSINFPQHYPNSQHCFYTISTNYSVIELEFERFHTESTADRGLRGSLCDRDYVEIYVGNENHRVCGNWTGREHLLLFRSFGNKIVFKFVSDEQETRSGFYGSWRVVEKSHVTECLSQILDTENHRFEILFTSQTWGDGEFDCRSRGGHLAKIADIATQILLTEHLLER